MLNKSKYIKVIIIVIILIPALLLTRYISTSAFSLDKQTRLDQFVTLNDVPVSKKIVEDGYEQIYYTFEDEDTFITDSRTAKGDPLTDREYITWMEEVNGTWQIYLYNIPTQKLVQLTKFGNNLDPKISNGNVVWRGWTGDTWQIFVYDGKVIKQISQGSLSESPDIENDFVVFSQKFSQGWQDFAYYIKTDDLKPVDNGFQSGSLIKIRDGDIFYGKTEKDITKFAQKVNEIFLLDIPFEASTGNAQTIDENSMRDYLEKLIQDAETLQNSGKKSTVQGIQDNTEDIIETIESASSSAELKMSTPSASTTTPSATQSGETK